MQGGGFEPPKALSHQITPALKMPPFSFGHPALFSFAKRKGRLESGAFGRFATPAKSRYLRKLRKELIKNLCKTSGFP